VNIWEAYHLDQNSAPAHNKGILFPFIIIIVFWFPLSLVIGEDRTTIPHPPNASVPQKLPNVPFSDITKESEELVSSAPAMASSGRVSVTVYGGDNRLLTAAYRGAQEYAAQDDGHDAYFLWAKDKDNNPNTVDVDFFVKGVWSGTLTIKNPDDYPAIQHAVTDRMNRAYTKGFSVERLEQGRLSNGRIEP